MITLEGFRQKVFSTTEKKANRDEDSEDDEGNIPPYILNSVAASGQLIGYSAPKFINDIDLMKSTSSAQSMSIPTHKIEGETKNMDLDYIGSVKMTKNDAKTERKTKKSDIKRQDKSSGFGSPIDELASPVLDKLSTVQSQQSIPTESRKNSTTVKQTKSNLPQSKNTGLKNTLNKLKSNH